MLTGGGTCSVVLIFAADYILQSDISSIVFLVERRREERGEQFFVIEGVVSLVPSNKVSSVVDFNFQHPSNCYCYISNRRNHKLCTVLKIKKGQLLLAFVVYIICNKYILILSKSNMAEQKWLAANWVSSFVHKICIVV